MAAHALDAQHARGEVHRPLLLTLKGNRHRHPYTDVDLSATFAGPHGETMQVPGYWDGASTWRIRFVPPAEGLWRFVTTAPSDPHMHGLEGTVTAVDNGAHGFLRIDPDHPYAFRRTRGEPILPMGDTLWNGMSGSGQPFGHGEFQRLVDVRASQHFTFLRCYACAVYPEAECDAHGNEGGRAFEPWDPDALNPQYFQEAERRIGYANGRGLTVHLLFGSDGDNLTAFFGWGNGKLERYIRYCCARFGGFDVCWEGRAEYEEQGASPPGAIALANRIGHWVERYDPCRHLQSMHTTGSNRDLAREPWLDWVMHQAQRWDWILQDRRYGKPVMNEEFYYEDSGAGRTHRHHSDADTVRRSAWKLMTAGASGLAYGNTGTLHARAMPFRGLEYLQSPGARAMTNLYEFWSHLQFWELAPAAPLGLEDFVSSPRGEYVGYVEDRTPRRPTLGPGRHTYQWYNPRTGSWLEERRQVRDLGDPPVFVAPEQGDWVLHVARAGSGS